MSTKSNFLTMDNVEVLYLALFRVSIDIKLSNLRLKGNLYIKEVPHVYHGSR